MLLIDLFKLYRKLDTKEKNFIKNQGVDASMSIPKWMRFLEPLCQFDEKCDAGKSAILKILVLAGIALFISFFIGIGAIIIPLLLVFIALFIIYRALRRLDINNNIRNVIYPLLHVLALEVGNNKKVSLNINFTKKMHKSDISNVDDNSTMFNKQKAVFYDYDVLNLECSLPDKTKLCWKVKDTIRKRTRTNPRGKTKTKTKLKRRILIHLTFDKKMYQLDSKIKTTNKTINKFKVRDSKISYKDYLKQSADDAVADIELEKLLEQTYQPYQFLTAQIQTSAS